MNRTYDFPFHGTKKGAGPGMVLRPGPFKEDIPFIFVYFCMKQGPCRHGTADVLEEPDLLLQLDIIPHAHAAGAALDAGEGHLNNNAVSPENASGIFIGRGLL